ncbi:hypothetical protein A3D00_04990 [Candidatus Woesebacteria bacterium RIFCSPHIGHO2_02_FULL_38_9]|nr:MAG: hypothetical protein A3D00_04990 [Candidatus Woesebacteria bacterium RIFCSPHIGHO2_02_FULL_38_9]OGM57412.1 MAG: hypothetical protein A3A50_05765 [Candidatus Woesebacteria bacterium RIFCSPLOWO2_01_FULL_38_20]
MKEALHFPYPPVMLGNLPGSINQNLQFLHLPLSFATLGGIVEYFEVEYNKNMKKLEKPGNYAFIDSQNLNLGTGRNIYYKGIHQIKNRFIVAVTGKHLVSRTGGILH